MMGKAYLLKYGVAFIFVALCGIARGNECTDRKLGNLTVVNICEQGTHTIPAVYLSASSADLGNGTRCTCTMVSPSPGSNGTSLALNQAPRVSNCSASITVRGSSHVQYTCQSSALNNPVFNNASDVIIEVLREGSADFGFCLVMDNIGSNTGNFFNVTCENDAGQNETTSTSTTGMPFLTSVSPSPVLSTQSSNSPLSSSASSTSSSASSTPFDSSTQNSDSSTLSSGSWTLSTVSSNSSNVSLPLSSQSSTLLSASSTLSPDSSTPLNVLLTSSSDSSSPSTNSSAPPSDSSTASSNSLSSTFNSSTTLSATSSPPFNTSTTTSDSSTASSNSSNQLPSLSTSSFDSSTTSSFSSLSSSQTQTLSSKSSSPSSVVSDLPSDSSTPSTTSSTPSSHSSTTPAVSSDSSLGSFTSSSGSPALLTFLSVSLSGITASFSMTAYPGITASSSITAYPGITASSSITAYPGITASSSITAYPFSISSTMPSDATSPEENYYTTQDTASVAPLSRPTAATGGGSLTPSRGPTPGTLEEPRDTFTFVALAAGICGALLFLFLIAMIIVVICRRRKRKKREQMAPLRRGLVLLSYPGFSNIPLEDNILYESSSAFPAGDTPKTGSATQPVEGKTGGSPTSGKTSVQPGRGQYLGPAGDLYSLVQKPREDDGPEDASSAQRHSTAVDAPADDEEDEEDIQFMQDHEREQEGEEEGFFNAGEPCAERYTIDYEPLEECVTAL